MNIKIVTKKRNGRLLEITNLDTVELPEGQTEYNTSLPSRVIGQDINCTCSIAVFNQLAPNAKTREAANFIDNPDDPTAVAGIDNIYIENGALKIKA